MIDLNERFALDYVQMSFAEFARRFPVQASEVPMLKVFLSDPNYLVRIRDDKLEIGYTEDAWEIESL